MHPNPCFHPEDRARSLATCRALVEQVGFAMTFATTPHGFRVVHAPVIWTGDRAVQFHIARSNIIAPHLAGATALCVVNGPNAYVSPRWYRDPTSVPTWNYVAAELEGSVRQLDERTLRRQIETLITTSEARLCEEPVWTMDQAAPDDVEAMIPQIVGFELDVQDWRATVKLSQNKPALERERIAVGLDATGASEMAQQMRDFPA